MVAAEESIDSRAGRLERRILGPPEGLPLLGAIASGVVGAAALLGGVVFAFSAFDPGEGVWWGWSLVAAPLFLLATLMLAIMVGRLVGEERRGQVRRSGGLRALVGCAALVGFAAFASLAALKAPEFVLGAAEIAAAVGGVAVGLSALHVLNRALPWAVAVLAIVALFATSGLQG